MNSVQGIIRSIQTVESLSLVSVEAATELVLKAIVIETPETAAYLRIDGVIKVLFKETEVIIGTREVHAISLQNRIPATITDIEYGSLISKLSLQSEVADITSIISTKAVQQLDLKTGMSVLAMIKLNEMMLSE